MEHSTHSYQGIFTPISVHIVPFWVTMEGPWSGGRGVLCWTLPMAIHQEHVMIIKGWSGALGVNLVAKIWQHHVALTSSSHPPSMLLPGCVLTKRKHTVASLL